VAVGVEGWDDLSDLRGGFYALGSCNFLSVIAVSHSTLPRRVVAVGLEGWDELSDLRG
jgi:hypothetical protein